MALPEADKDCDDAIKIDPTFMKSYIRKAAIQFAKKDYKKCLDICNDALVKDTEKKHVEEIEHQV
jgi:stress-induced-phosphoprotein 1